MNYAVLWCVAGRWCGSVAISETESAAERDTQSGPDMKYVVYGMAERDTHSGLDMKCEVSGRVKKRCPVGAGHNI